MCYEKLSIKTFNSKTNRMKKSILVFFVIVYGLTLSAQKTVDINPDLLEKQWSAKWITHPEITGTEYGVYSFCKTIELTDDVSNWQNIKEEAAGKPIAGNENWRSKDSISLQARNVPAMNEIQQRFASVRRSEISFDTDAFIEGKKAIPIPVNSTVQILLDQSVLSNAFPVLNCSKGKGSSIHVSYAESLFANAKNRNKGNRKAIESNTISGNHDIILRDGGALFAMLSWI